MPERELDEIIKLHDQNKNDKISFQEFKSIFMSRDEESINKNAGADQL